MTSESKPVVQTKAARVFEPIKPLITAEQMDAITSRQPVQTWAEMRAQINRSLGRPLDSD